MKMTKMMLIIIRNLNIETMMMKKRRKKLVRKMKSHPIQLLENKTPLIALKISILMKLKRSRKSQRNQLNFILKRR